jgi:hypothetical protein
LTLSINNKDSIRSSSSEWIKIDLNVPHESEVAEEFLYATTMALQHHLKVYYGRDDMRIQPVDVVKAVYSPLEDTKENWHYNHAWIHLWELLNGLPIENISMPSSAADPQLLIEDTVLTPQQLNFIGTISPPLLRYMLIEGEYADRKLTDHSSMGSMPPIFVVGFPRSGLTLLQTLISFDPRSRTPKVWESMYDIGDSRALTYHERHEAAKQLFIEEAVAAGRTVDSVSQEKESSSSHLLFPFQSEMDPADDEYILGNALSCNIIAYEFQAGPAAIRWSRQLDVQIKQMEFHKRWVQLYHNLTVSEIERKAAAVRKVKRLQSMDQNNSLPEFWVFRGSDHVERIESILSVYPDAKFVWTHHSIKAAIRKQLEIAVKAMGSNTLFPTPNFIRMIGESIGRSLDVLESLPDLDNRVFHLQLADLLSNPVEAIQKIYDQFDMGELHPLHVKRIEKWIQKHWRESKESQVSWARAWRLLGMQSEQELLDMYHDYLRRFPENL